MEEKETPKEQEQGLVLEDSNSESVAQRKLGPYSKLTPLEIKEAIQRATGNKERFESALKTYDHVSISNLKYRIKERIHRRISRSTSDEKILLSKLNTKPDTETPEEQEERCFNELLMVRLKRRWHLTVREIINEAIRIEVLPDVPTSLKINRVYSIPNDTVSTTDTQPISNDSQCRQSVEMPNKTTMSSVVQENEKLDWDRYENELECRDLLPTENEDHNPEDIFNEADNKRLDGESVEDWISRVSVNINDQKLSKSNPKRFFIQRNSNWNLTAVSLAHLNTKDQLDRCFEIVERLFQVAKTRLEMETADPSEIFLRQCKEKERKELEEKINIEKASLISKVQEELHHKLKIFSKETLEQRQSRIARDIESMKEVILRNLKRNIEWEGLSREQRREKYKIARDEYKIIHKQRMEKIPEETKAQKRAINSKNAVIRMRNERLEHRIFASIKECNTAEDLRALLLEHADYQPCIEYWFKYKGKKIANEVLTYRKTIYELVMKLGNLQTATVEIEEGFKDFIEFLKSQDIIMKHLIYKKDYASNLQRKRLNEGPEEEREKRRKYLNYKFRRSYQIKKLGIVEEPPDGYVKSRGNKPNTKRPKPRDINAPAKERLARRKPLASDRLQSEKNGVVAAGNNDVNRSTIDIGKDCNGVSEPITSESVHDNDSSGDEFADTGTYDDDWTPPETFQSHISFLGSTLFNPHSSATTSNNLIPVQSIQNFAGQPLIDRPLTQPYFYNQYPSQSYMGNVANTEQVFQQNQYPTNMTTQLSINQMPNLTSNYISNYQNNFQRGLSNIRRSSRISMRKGLFYNNEAAQEDYLEQTLTNDLGVSHGHQVQTSSNFPESFESYGDGDVEQSPITVDTSQIMGRNLSTTKSTYCPSSPLHQNHQQVKKRGRPKGSKNLNSNSSFKRQSALTRKAPENKLSSTKSTLIVVPRPLQLPDLTPVTQMRQEFEKSLLKCPQCNNIFVSQDELEKHLKNKRCVHPLQENNNDVEGIGISGIPELVPVPSVKPKQKSQAITCSCTICSTEFCSLLTYLNHIRWYHFSEKWTCLLCSEENVNESPRSFKWFGATRHVLDVHPGTFVLGIFSKQFAATVNKFACNKCTAIFENYPDLLEHYFATHFPLKYCCQICGILLQDDDHMRYHLQLFHYEQVRTTGRVPELQQLEVSKNNICVCDICHSEFISLSYLDKHKKDGHNFVKGNDQEKETPKVINLFYCINCPNQYQTIEKRDIHLQQCKFQDFICAFCKKLFLHDAELKSHVEKEHPFSNMVPDSGASIYKYTTKENYNGSQYKCEICQHFANKISKLLIHYCFEHDLLDLIKSVSPSFEIPITNPFTFSEKVIVSNPKGDDGEIFKNQVNNSTLPSTEQIPQPKENNFSTEKTKMKYKCPKCKIDISRENFHMNHKLYSKLLRRYCIPCKRRFSRPVVLVVHNRSAHNIDSTSTEFLQANPEYDEYDPLKTEEESQSEHFTCGICTASFSTEQFHRHHSFFSTKDPDQKYCKVCNVYYKHVYNHKIKCLANINANVEDEMEGEKAVVKPGEHLIPKGDNITNNVRPPQQLKDTDYELLFDSALTTLQTKLGEMEIWTCRACFKNFKTKEFLRQHLSQFHQHDAFCRIQCKVCSCTFTTAASYSKHRKRFHVDVIHEFQCPYCPRTLSRMEHLRTHIKAVHKKTTFDGRLVKKVTVKAKQDAILCKFCNKQFQTEDKLKFHLSDKHFLINSTSFCDFCGLQMKPERLSDHLKYVHKDKQLETQPSVKSNKKIKPAGFNTIVSLDKFLQLLHEVRESIGVENCKRMLGKSMNVKENPVKNKRRGLPKIVHKSKGVKNEDELSDEEVTTSSSDNDGDSTDYSWDENADSNLNIKYLVIKPEQGKRNVPRRNRSRDKINWDMDGSDVEGGPNSADQESDEGEEYYPEKPSKRCMPVTSDNRRTRRLKTTSDKLRDRNTNKTMSRNNITHNNIEEFHSESEMEATVGPTSDYEKIPVIILERCDQLIEEMQRKQKRNS